MNQLLQEQRTLSAEGTPVSVEFCTHSVETTQVTALRPLPLQVCVRAPWGPAQHGLHARLRARILVFGGGLIN